MLRRTYSMELNIFMLEATKFFEKAFYRYDLLDPMYRIDLEASDEVPSKDDWMKRKMMLNFLRVFYEVTCKISGSLHVSSNLFLHEIYKVQYLLKTLMESSDDGLRKMAKNMKYKFDKYWGDRRKMNKLIFIALVLDHRYKMNFLTLALTRMYNVGLTDSIAKGVQDELVVMCGDYKKPIVTKKVDENVGIELPIVSLDDNDVLKDVLEQGKYLSRIVPEID